MKSLEVLEDIKVTKSTQINPKYLSLLSKFDFKNQVKRQSAFLTLSFSCVSEFLVFVVEIFQKMQICDRFSSYCLLCLNKVTTFSCSCNKRLKLTRPVELYFFNNAFPIIKSRFKLENDVDWFQQS